MKAISVSPGYALGKVLILQNEIDLSSVARIATNAAEQIQELQRAVQKSVSDIQALVNQFRAEKKDDQAEIFEAHAMMVEDPEVLDETIELIKKENLSAAWAYRQTSESYAEKLAALDDAYLKERAADVRDIAGRVLHNLLGTGAGEVDLKKLPLNTVLVAHDITPSQISALEAKQVGSSVMGIITEVGGKNSHTAILARGLEIPAVSGARDIIKKIKNGDEILFDAFKGEITIGPSPTELQEFRQKKQQYETKKSELLALKGQKSVTLDGRVIQLAANIGGAADVESLFSNDAEAVGLYRTEFVFLNHNRVPSQEEQFKIYREVLEKLAGKHCIIRTLDIGGDKQLEGLSVAHEENPFLGLRGVRLCLQEKELFKNQLKAILRAAHGHSVGIMVPMISNVEEILATKEILKECEAELVRDQQAFSKDYQLGVMIEVPSAAMIVDLISRHVDFISIGTNDLTQYVCAADRMNDKVEKIYDPYNPGFLRTMFMILDTARKNNLHSGICGSLAHAELLVPLFIGMGVNELSMTSQHVLETRKWVRGLNYEDCKKIVNEILQLETSAAIQARLKNLLHS